MRQATHLRLQPAFQCVNLTEDNAERQKDGGGLLEVEGGNREIKVGREEEFGAELFEPCTLRLAGGLQTEPPQVNSQGVAEASRLAWRCKFYKAQRSCPREQPAPGE